jgi:hypothetical protein
VTPRRGSFLTPECGRRVLQILQDAIKHALIVESRREQPGDVLHHKHGRPMIGNDLQVFDVQKLPGV